MKVNRPTSLKTDSKISLKCCWKLLVFQVRFHTFSSATPLCHPDHCHLSYRVFTHQIQAIKFNLVYRVVTREGLLAAERLRTFWCYNNIASAYWYFSKSELKRRCCCHVTHKSKSKVKNTRNVKRKEDKAFHECVEWMQ